jgi:hypothetical protein
MCINTLLRLVAMTMTLLPPVQVAHLAMVLPQQHFWCHILQGAYNFLLVEASRRRYRYTGAVQSFYSLRDAKVCQHQSPGSAHQDIASFDVAVDKASGMHRTHAMCQLSRNVENLRPRGSPPVAVQQALHSHAALCCV